MICSSNQAKSRFLRPAQICLSAFRGALMFVVVLLTFAIPAGAQEPELGVKPNQKESLVPDPDNGKVLAGKLCVACHMIEQGAGSVPQADVPSFPAIANRPDQSIEALTNWLLAPHAPMPDPHLTREEVRDLAGYILSLSKRRSDGRSR